MQKLRENDDKRGDMLSEQEQGGLKSEGSRLFRSMPDGGACLITLSWPPHAVTARTGQECCREEWTGP